MAVAPVLIPRQIEFPVGRILRERQPDVDRVEIDPRETIGVTPITVTLARDRHDAPENRGSPANTFCQSRYPMTATSTPFSMRFIGRERSADRGARTINGNRFADAQPPRVLHLPRRQS
jgi:hypothetical protein